MGVPFRLTARPIRVGSSGAKQDLQDALDVSAFAECDVVCVVDGVTGTSTTGLAIRLITGMTKETEDGWVVLVSFTAANLTAVAGADIVNASTKMLKYLRWEVTGLGGASNMTFDLQGMLRTRS